jgi:hypothetical protein
MGAKRWVRRTNSPGNFDLCLANPDELSSQMIIELLDHIQAEQHRGLSLSAHADHEFRRWCRHPKTPLKSDAYVLLSNWFLTLSGDRRSIVASHCQVLWDELFPVRPQTRLSLPKPGKNHIMVPHAFEDFWMLLANAQGEKYERRADRYDNAVEKTTRQSEAGEPSTTEHKSSRFLTILEAKKALALTFGVSPENVEIIIRS